MGDISGPRIKSCETWEFSLPREKLCGEMKGMGGVEDDIGWTGERRGGEGKRGASSGVVREMLTADAAQYRRYKTKGTVGM